MSEKCKSESSNAAGQKKLRQKLTQEAMFKTPCASVNECTGICPTVPQNDSEAKSYSSVYDVPVSPKKKHKK